MKKSLIIFSAVLIAGLALYRVVILPPGSTLDRSLVASARDRDVPGVQKAVESGAKINATLTDSLWDRWFGAPNPEPGYMAIHYSIDHGDIPTTLYLLDHGADVNAKTTQGNTPLMFAANHLDAKMITLLIRHGADGNIKNRFGKVAADLTRKRMEDDQSRNARFLLTGVQEKSRSGGPDGSRKLEKARDHQKYQSRTPK